MNEENKIPPDNAATVELFNKLLNAQLEKFVTLSEAIIEKKTLEITSQKKQKAEDEKQTKGRSLSSFLDLISYFSNQASSANRSLALAGIAIIWIVKKPEKQAIQPGLLNIPLTLLAVSLGFDLLQYFLGAVGWYSFYEYKYFKYKQHDYQPEHAKDIQAPNAISIPISILFVLKVGAMIAAYCYI